MKEPQNDKPSNNVSANSPHCKAIPITMTIAPTKYWHMALSNPSLADATEFCDKLNETAFCLYGHDTTFTGYLLEAFVVFKSRKSAESVKRMFSKATVSRIRYVFEAMDAIESYENCVRVG